MKLELSCRPIVLSEGPSLIASFPVRFRGPCPDNRPEAGVPRLDARVCRGGYSAGSLVTNQRDPVPLPRRSVLQNRGDTPARPRLLYLRFCRSRSVSPLPPPSPSPPVSGSSLSSESPLSLEESAAGARAAFLRSRSAKRLNLWARVSGWGRWIWRGRRRISRPRRRKFDAGPPDVGGGERGFNVQTEGEYLGGAAGNTHPHSTRGNAGLLRHSSSLCDGHRAHR